MEQEVSAFIDEWQQTTDKTFSVYGQTFEELVKKRQNEYVADKENEKILRVSIALLPWMDVGVICSLFVKWCAWIKRLAYSFMLQCVFVEYHPLKIWRTLAHIFGGGAEILLTKYGYKVSNYIGSYKDSGSNFWQCVESWRKAAIVARPYTARYSSSLVYFVSFLFTFSLSFPLRIVPLHFQAAYRRRRLNL